MKVPSLLQQRSRYLLALYLTVAAWGVRAALLPQARQLSGIVLAVVAAVLSIQLVHTDARLRGKPLPSTTKWQLLLVWPLALPIYTVATRKLRGIWLVTKHLVLALLVYFVVATLAWLVASIVTT
jgi:hypothetical protein